MSGTDPRPPLPDWILEIYEILLERANDRDGQSVESHGQDHVAAITREQALDHLLAIDDLELEAADVDYALQRLLKRGYFYEVDEELRVTDEECRNPS